MADLPAVSDPFSIVHRSIWAALKASQAWRDCFNFQGRARETSIRFDEGKDWPAKLELAWQPGDTPLVAVLQGRMSLVPSANSLAVGLLQAFPLIVVGGDLNVLPFNALKWQTLRALLAAGDDLGLPKLVRGWTMTDGADDAQGGRPMWTKGQQRWTAVAGVTVEMFVSKASVAANMVPSA